MSCPLPYRTTLVMVPWSAKSIPFDSDLPEVCIPVDFLVVSLELLREVVPFLEYLGRDNPRLLQSQEHPFPGEHPFGNHPFGNHQKGSLGDKRAVSKRMVLANVPSFRFSFRGNIRQNHPFGNHPFANPRGGGEVDFLLKFPGGGGGVLQEWPRIARYRETISAIPP